MHIEFGTGRTTALQSLASPAVIGVVTALLGPVGGVTAATGAKIDGSLRAAIAKAAGSATGAAVSDERLRDRLATAVRESMERAFRRVGADPNLIPSDQTMFEDLLWAFGAWESLEEMNAAMATRCTPRAPAAVWASGSSSSRRRHNRIRDHLGWPAGPMARTTLDNAALAWPVRTARRQTNSTT